MIPSTHEARLLWEKYALPKQKQVHMTLVAAVAVWLARKLLATRSDIHIDVALLEVAGLLHDIDKAIPKLPGERHPDAGVRVLREEKMMEVADLVKTHSLHAILDPNISPKTWEEKLLYLADKMVKYEVITVDKRFELWRNEALPVDARKILDATYPKVKLLEKEIFTSIGIAPESVAKFIQPEYT